MILALLLAAGAAAAAPAPEALGRDFAAAAARAGITRVAVQPFGGEEDVPESVRRDAADAVLRGLLDSGRVRAVERESLPSVLSEARLAAAGATAGSGRPRLEAGDGVLLGRLRRAATGWTASLRLVSSTSGEIVAGGEALLPEEKTARPAESDEFPPLAAIVDAAHFLSSTRGRDEIAALERNRSASAAQRAAAVLALAESGADEWTLADALGDPEPLVRFAGAVAVGRGGEAWAEGPLRRILKADASWPARFAAAQALSRFDSPASAADLTAAKNGDGSWRVRRQAAASLAQRGEAAP
jgi:hypothetical protein